jgi:hypothetical protein
MAVRALHPIVLAGALLALPAVVAWAPAGAGSKSLTVVVPRVQPAHPPASIVIPVEISEHGAAPIRKQIEVQLDPVPEPSSLLLLTASSLLLLRRRRSN